HDLLAGRSSAGRRAGEITRLGNRAQPGPAWREWLGGPDLQSFRCLHRFDLDYRFYHSRRDSVYRGVPLPRSDQSGEGDGSADITQAWMGLEVNKHESWQVSANAAEL